MLVLLATAGVGGWLLTRPAGSPAARTITATVAAGSFEQTVTATGTVQPTRQADLDFAVSGRVTSVKVQPGDKVEKGQVLARLDRTSLEAALTSAEAQLEAAEAQYDDDLDADASATQLAADTAAVAAAESALSQAQDDLDAATLTASMTGTVATVDLTVGDQVSGTSPSTDDGATAPDSGNQNAATSTTSQVVVVSPRLFTVEADVAADDVAGVEKGMQAKVTPTGATEPVFGTVSSVGLVAEVNESGAATFPVTVTITGPQTGLYAGTSANVSVITQQVTDVLSVPTMALHTEGSTTYVEKLVAGKKVRTTVELGETYGASTEVTSGLVAGDKVVIASFRPPTGNTDRGGTNPGGQFPEGGFPGGGGPPPGGGTGTFP